VETPTPMSGAAPFTCAYFGGSAYDPLDLARALNLDGLCMSIQPQIYFNPRLVDGQYFVDGGFLHSRQDLPRVRLVDPGDKSLYQPACDFLERVHAQGLATGCFINLASDPVVLGMGWDYFSYALFDDRQMVETLFDLYSDWNARAVDHICSLGFDFIWAGDDIAFKSGPMISPKLFRELFLPYYRRVTERITLPWIFHTDGNFLPVLEDLLSLGMDALHPIEPEAVDIRDVRQRVGGRATLVGNIDINLLSNGSPEEVAAVTRETIRLAGADGRFILSSSNSITRSCQVENVLAMVQTCRDFGRYPIDPGIEEAWTWKNTK
jgi:hypothetical protein